MFVEGGEAIIRGLNFLILMNMPIQERLFAEIFSLTAVNPGIGRAEVYGDAGSAKYLPEACEHGIVS